ncbi:hypothetical protein ACUR5C_12970 [Aliikangiella sp. IMCC44653]
MPSHALTSLYGKPIFFVGTVIGEQAYEETFPVISSFEEEIPQECFGGFAFFSSYFSGMLLAEILSWLTITESTSLF